MTSSIAAATTTTQVTLPIASTSSPSVTVIPATIDLRRPETFREDAKRRVAAYARVSTDSDEQLNSYRAQVDYYTKYIKGKADWSFVDVYTDEGITGTSTKCRRGFNDLVSDALTGRIDLIVTKSVARFARNTLDSLTTVRKLKEHGVEVYFEKENIWTFDGKSEVLLTIMSSLAQDESRSISENVTWGHRKRMADGKVNMAYKQFLGYAKGEDGEPVIVESEAETVRLIYRLYLAGHSFTEVANQLTASGIPTPSGKQKWGISTVRSILQNEKYKGDALLQKSFTVDFLTKKTKVNEGEVPQYYVENSHPAIIEPATFDLVQSEIRRRKVNGKHPVRANLFSSKIICSECGGYFGSKVWHSKSKYRRTVWQCNSKYKTKGNKCCNAPHIYERNLKDGFVKAVNQLLTNKEQYVDNYSDLLDEVFSTSELDNRITAMQDECTIVAELVQKCVNENARVAQSQSEYERRYNGLTGRYEAAKAELNRLQAEKTELAAKRAKVRQFATNLKAITAETGVLITYFDENMWRTLINNVTVDSAGNLLFTFKDCSIVSVDSLGK